MPRNIHGSNAILAIFVFTFGSIACGQNAVTFPDFSAVQVFESRKANMEMKVYVSGSNVRVERSKALSTLYMPNQSKVYNLTTYPDNSRQCVVMKPEQAKMLPSPRINSRLSVETHDGGHGDGRRTFVQGRKCRCETA